MEVRFYIDPESELPHISNHDVRKSEVVEVLESPLEDGGGTDGARVAIGQTETGRFLKVIYVPETKPESVFVNHGL